MALLVFAIGCGSNEQSDSYFNPARIRPNKAPVYLIDGVSEEIHSCSGVLNNEDSSAAVYVFEGVSCGCLVAEHNGKVLVEGDKIRIAAEEAEEVMLRNRLAYAEGFYSNSAFFQTVEAPTRRVVVESQYGVMKRLRLSPGALVFERDEEQGLFAASATVTFRSTGGGDRVYRLSVAKLPDSIHSQLKQESQGIEKRLSPTSKLFYEDEWSVLLRIDSGAHLGPSLPPHGEIEFEVFDSQGELAANMLLPYNADCIGKVER